MATSAKLISVFFLISLFSVAIQARESQFFSKITHDNTANKETTDLNNNNVKETQLPTKEESLNKQEPEPTTFVPETQNSYGLYGHETGSNYEPYVTTATGYKEPYEAQQQYLADTKFRDNSYNTDRFAGSSYTTKAYENLADTKFRDNSYNTDRFAGSSYTTKAYEKNNYNNVGDEDNRNGYQNYQQPNFYHNNGGNGYNNHQGFTDTRLTVQNDNGYNTMANQNENFYGHGGFNNYKNAERQGLSDTRFLENGRYFYDINKEKFVPFSNQFENNEYNNNNNRNNYYGNNVDFYENNKSMEGYQNQEDEFDIQDEFQP